MVAGLVCWVVERARKIVAAGSGANERRCGGWSTAAGQRSRGLSGDPAVVEFVSRCQDPCD